MKLLIDLQSCQSGSNLGGIGRYSLQLTKAIAEIADHEIWLLLNSRLPAAMQVIRQEFINLIPQDQIIVFDSLAGVNELSVRSISRTKAAELTREKFISDLQPDAVLTTSLFEGLADDVVTSIRSLQDTPYVEAVILYDLIPLIKKDTYLSELVYYQHYMRKIEHIERSDLLLAISEFSRDEGREFLKINPDDIVNISSAANEFFSPQIISEDDEYRLYDRLGISKRFLLYTASFDPRKNQKALIEAFSLLPRSVRRDYQLVIAGNGSQPVYDSLLTFAAERGLRPKDVLFVGRIDDETLRQLYHLCHLFVFPSLCEGFGLPVLEAMSCGCPVIGSNSTSIPEVIGREDALFDPTSTKSISEKMLRALTDKEFYADLRRHAPQQAKCFGWKRSARIALEALERKVQEMSKANRRKRSANRFDLIKAIAKACTGEAVTDATLHDLSTVVAQNEFRVEIISQTRNLSNTDRGTELGVVSTWNTPCGIASYTRSLLDGFKGKYIVFAPHATDLDNEDGPNVVRCWNAGRDESLDILKDEILRSGVQSAMIQWNYGFFNLAALSKVIFDLKQAGLTVLVELHATIDPPQDQLPRRLADLVEALRVCDRVLVHSSNDLERLRDFGITASLFPHGVSRPEPTPSSLQRLDTDFIIATYGFFLPSKGLVQLIEAMDGLEVEGRKVRLFLVNAEHPNPLSAEVIAAARDTVRRLGLEDRVEFVTAYLSNGESLGHLKQADLIVYAYQKTAESASGAIRLGLSSGVPVAVTPQPIFDDVSSVVHRLPGTSPVEIRTGIADLARRIQTADPSIGEVATCCKRWLETANFNNLGRVLRSVLLLSQAEKKGYSNSFFFTPVDGTLLTVIGELMDGSFHSRGKEGFLSYGPYIGLPEGRYTLQIHFSAPVQNTFDAIMLGLCHRDGSIEPENISDDFSKGYIEVQFSLSTPVTAFETQIVARSGVDVALHGLVLFAPMVH